MSWDIAREGMALLLLTAGCLLTLLAAVGVVRLPSLLTRMHAATKPQGLGLVLALLGLALWVDEPGAWGGLVLVILFQLLTVPVAAHMEGRGALSTGLLDGPIHDMTHLTTHEHDDLPDQVSEHREQMADFRQATARQRRGAFVAGAGQDGEGPR